jgi:hypothetical protein
VSSLGLLDLVQIAAEGLAPRSQYDVYIADSNRPPFGKRQSLALLKANPDGAGIVQALGPLKVLAPNGSTFSNAASRRFLIVSDVNDAKQVVLRQVSTASDYLNGKG